MISTQIESLTQMECTQQSQFEDVMTPTPLSPPAPLPWGRLVPCVPSKDNPPIALVQKSEYWLGRSVSKCDIPVFPGTSLSKRENTMMEWAHSMISNQHCRITLLPPATCGTGSTASAGNVQHKAEEGSADEAGGGGGSSRSCSIGGMQQQQTPMAPQIVIEDHSGNGTFVNQSVHLGKGHQRMLHSGDEICLVNAETLRKRIASSRMLQTVLQQYTYVLVLTNKPKRPCVNPRAMNYVGTQTAASVDRGLASPRSARRVEAHYEIREILGDGTSGQVRRAIHRQTGQEYAVKVISLRRQLDLTSMEHEVNMMQSLDHPYIVQLVDVFVHHGIAMYLVMELVSGGDLFDRIVQQERYTEVDARRVMRRLLSAVHYLHQNKNIVHRDLKPENILCGSNPTHVKLADFGLAKIIQSDGLKTFCGTPQYFAPEVLQRRTTVAGSGRYGKPADMWSLGVILFILLSGHPPFEADLDPLQAFDSIDFDHPIWKGMPQAQELVQQMLRLDPKRRITVRQACNHPWINIEDGDTHVHPLDDPAVTGRKRLFSEPTEPKQHPAPMAEEDVESIVSKESMLSKEDFAAAATSSHQRAESVDYVDLKNCLEENAEDVGTTGEPSDVSEDASTSSKMEFSPEKGEQMDTTDTVETTDNIDGPLEKHTDSDPASPTKSEQDMSASPDIPSIGIIGRELSVTPSECGDDDLPRSPLAAMNLNERSNRFRSQVLHQQQGQCEDESSTAPPSPSRRSPRDTSQVAVTPTASNVRPNPSEKSKVGALFCNDDDEEDPILSQFSSGPSSLESFPDSPAKVETPVVPPKDTNNKKNKDSQRDKKRKRKVPDEQDPDSSSDQPDTKRPNHKQVRQTKLSSWFVSKKTKSENDN